MIDYMTQGYVATLPPSLQERFLKIWPGFVAAMDERMLDMATTPNHEWLLSLQEYDLWIKDRSLAKIRRRNWILDALAASFQDGARTIPRGDDYWILHNAILDRLGVCPELYK